MVNKMEAFELEGIEEGDMALVKYRLLKGDMMSRGAVDEPVVFDVVGYVNNKNDEVLSLSFYDPEKVEEAHERYRSLHTMKRLVLDLESIIEITKLVPEEGE